MLFVHTTAADENLLIDIRRDTRADSVKEKIQQLEQAYDAGRLDVALSLAESLKDTLDCEKQLRSNPGKPHINANFFGDVSNLPASWANWARGWTYFKSLTLTEPAGIARSQEPVDVLLALPFEQSTDLYRDIRVALVDLASHTLRETPSQVYHVRRRGKIRTCRLLFFADLPAGGEANYLVFYGNRLAELPSYPTDLQSVGEGYDLDIANDHFVAYLSSQTGQLERLRYKRQHGLELYAGGKGHGEPPTIDWSGDYVDRDHYLVTQGGGRNTEGIRERLLQIDGVDRVIVDFTWEPAWTTDRLTKASRRALGLE